MSVELTWKRHKLAYGKPTIVLYAGENKLGHISASLYNSGFYNAVSYLPPVKNNGLIHQGKMNECQESLLLHAICWFEKCGCKNVTEGESDEGI